MSLRLSNLSGVLVFVAAIGFPFAAIAQSTSSTQTSRHETTSETFKRAFFKNDPEFFRNRSIGRQLKLIFGPGWFIQNSFPETEIRRDGRLVDILYQDVIKQQAASDPIIRTPDLPNPYETTILTSPRANGSRLRELLLRKPSQ